MNPIPELLAPSAVTQIIALVHDLACTVLLVWVVVTLVRKNGGPK